MQLEAGKKYTDRRGRVYGPLVTKGIFFCEHEDAPLWHRGGSIDGHRTLDMDLVAEYVEPVKASEHEYRMLTEGEVIQEGDEYRAWDNRWEKSLGIGKKWTSKIYVPHRRLVKPEETKAAEPAPVESPDDLVIQDRVPAREGIDFGWNVSLKDWDSYKPCEAWKWNINDKYAGRMHGSVGNIGRLAVFCYRKDLPPIESPDDWVTQDRVPPRNGVDEYLIENIHLMYVKKQPFELISLKHGDIVGDIGMLKVRCRRKDLPPVPPQKQKTRTVVLKEWLCWDEEDPQVMIVWAAIDPSEEWDADHAHATGNTRTVEIPVT